MEIKRLEEISVHSQKARRHLLDLWVSYMQPQVHCKFENSHSERERQWLFIKQNRWATPLEAKNSPLA